MVFADEPTGNLDSSASAEVLGLLRRAADEFGQTIVMVTHDANAASYADRLVLLADGRIVRDEPAGDTDSVLELMKTARLIVNRIAIRGLRERRARTIFTLIAVVLGVALISGTFVLTDTISKSFDKLVATAGENVDVKVLSRNTARASAPRRRRSPRPRGAGPRVDGVAAADGAFRQLSVDRGRRPRRARRPINGAPTLAFSAVPERFDPFEYEGRPPRDDGEIAALGDSRRGCRPAGSATASACRERRRSGHTSSSDDHVRRRGVHGGAAFVVLTLPRSRPLPASPGRSRISTCRRSRASPRPSSSGASARRSGGGPRAHGRGGRPAGVQGPLADPRLPQDRGCSSSGSSRCSSARSSSSTRSRSPSRSARGSSGCCGPSARRAGRSCGRWCSRPSLIGLVGSVLGLFAGIGLAPLLGLLGLSGGSPEHGSRGRGAHGRRGDRPRHRGDAAVEPRAGAARHPYLTHGRDARGLARLVEGQAPLGAGRCRAGVAGLGLVSCSSGCSAASRRRRR